MTCAVEHQMYSSQLCTFTIPTGIIDFWDVLTLLPILVHNYITSMSSAQYSGDSSWQSWQTGDCLVSVEALYLHPLQNDTEKPVGCCCISQHLRKMCVCCFRFANRLQCCFVDWPQWPGHQWRLAVGRLLTTQISQLGVRSDWKNNSTFSVLF